MKSEIKKIFVINIQLIECIVKIVYNFRIQNIDKALRLVTVAINQLNMLIELLLDNKNYFVNNHYPINNDFIMNLFSSLLEAQEKQDYVLLADIYEGQLMPFLIDIQIIINTKEGIIYDEIKYNENLRFLGDKDKEIFNALNISPNPNELLKKGYEIEYTLTGLMTLAIIDNGQKYYLHSNNNVINEANILANSWYSEEKSEYIIYGLGLAYHVKELIDINNDIIIQIYESDINIIQLACAFSDIKNLLSNTNVKLFFDPEFTKIGSKLSNINDNNGLYIHYPSLKNIKNNKIKEKFENYFIQHSSITNQINLMNSNFNSNIKNYNALVDELKYYFKNKDLYIIAAGPSLDVNYLQLKEVAKNNIILATGTVFRKLLKVGIEPNFVIVTDANERVYSQIKGFEQYQIPMLILSTAYKEFAQEYSGKKYLICQKDYKKAEEYAKKMGASLYRTGGSVSTTALDIGIQFECKRIIFLGLDLAYTDNFVHAEGTSRRNLADTKDLRQIEDIYGKKVYTSRSLDMYRQWIEKRISGAEGIEFIDATEGGARIKGMKTCKLSDVI